METVLFKFKMTTMGFVALASLFSMGCESPLSRFRNDNSGGADQGQGVVPPPVDYGDLRPMNETYAAVVQHTFSEVGMDFDPYVANGGTHLLFASTRHSPRADIYYQRADSRVIEQVTHSPNANEKQPQLSPDGTTIIFASDREGQWNIYETSFTQRGSMILEVVRNGRVNEQPSYSPDGSAIAYATWMPRKGQWYIATMNRKTQQEKLYGPGLFPKFSPDGKKILFQRPRTREPQWFSLWVLDLENEIVSELISSSTWAAVTPNWSPDGKKIIFAAINKSIHSKGPFTGDDIYTIWADGTHLVRLTNDDAPDWNPIWAQNGRVFFVSLRNGVQNIWSVLPRSIDSFHPDTVEAAKAGPGALDSL